MLSVLQTSTNLKFRQRNKMWASSLCFLVEVLLVRVSYCWVAKTAAPTNADMLLVRYCCDEKHLPNASSRSLSKAVSTKLCKHIHLLLSALQVQCLECSMAPCSVCEAHAVHPIE